LYTDLDENYRKTLTAHIEKYSKGNEDGPSFSIEFLYVEQYVKDFEFYKNKTSGTPTFYKMLLPYILPEEYKTSLMLDCDTIAQRDVAEFFETNLDGYLLGAVLDDVTFQRVYPGLYKTVRTEPGDKIDGVMTLKKPEDYINGGMLLFNAAAFRETFTIEDLFRNAHKVAVVEQDVLNMLCEGKIFIMHPKFNFQVLERWNDWVAPAVPEKYAREYNEARAAPVVVHLMQKPWNEIYNTYWGAYFFGYASRSPFFETILERMRKRDLLCCFSAVDANKNLKLFFKQKQYRQLLKCGSCAVLKGLHSIGRKLFAVKG
jgi:lipopolysaccharide biosynthesis glycosyltransferase